MTEWRDVEQATNALTLTLCVACDHCAAPIPINRPVQQVRCDKCQKTSELTRFHDMLVNAKGGGFMQGSRYTWQRLEQAGPQCRKCDRPVPLDGLLGKVGAHTSFACKGCGASLPTYPAPAWLRAELPGALQVFGGDPELGSDQAGSQSSSVPLALDRSQLDPIAMACPQCAAGLLIQASDERTLSCRYCQTGVFVPDALWWKLHPAKTMCAWTLSYTGRLVTASTLARYERQQRSQDKKREAEEKRAEAKRQKALRHEQHMRAAQEQKRLRSERRRGRYWIVFGLLSAAFLVTCLFALSSR